jgi:hypothetical protein
MDFSQIKIRCSSLGAIMTEPKSKEAKENGDLSETAKAHLIKVYARDVFGRSRDIVTKFMDKGIQAEGDSIELLSLVDNVKYEKNTDQLSNEFIQGTPDIIDESVIDVKTSWSMETFFAAKGKPIDKDYEYQLQGYLELTGAQTGVLAYCLVNTPESLVNDEKYRLLKRMDVATEENPDYKVAAAELEYTMIFDDVPLKYRVIRFHVEKNEELMQRVYEKVKRCRIWLEEFHNSF